MCASPNACAEECEQELDRRLYDPGAELVVHNVRVLCVDREIDVRRLPKIAERLVEPILRRARRDESGAMLSAWQDNASATHHSMLNDSASEHGIT